MQGLDGLDGGGRRPKCPPGVAAEDGCADDEEGFMGRVRGAIAAARPDQGRLAG
jgi:hypothetical protein